MQAPPCLPSRSRLAAFAACHGCWLVLTALLGCHFRPRALHVLLAAASLSCSFPPASNPSASTSRCVRLQPMAACRLRPRLRWLPGPRARCDALAASNWNYHDSAKLLQAAGQHSGAGGVAWRPAGRFADGAAVLWRLWAGAGLSGGQNELPSRTTMFQWRRRGGPGSSAGGRETTVTDTCKSGQRQQVQALVTTNCEWTRAGTSRHHPRHALTRTPTRSLTPACAPSTDRPRHLCRWTACQPTT